MIICGYPGIGKSTLAAKWDKIIDLESSCYIIDGKRVKHWQKIYCKIAKILSLQGYTVFISTHKEVRDYLKAINEKFYVICPDNNLKKEWSQKLKERFDDIPTMKNHDALMRVLTKFDDDISDLKQEKNCITIDNIDYNLATIIIDKIENRLDLTDWD